MKDWQTTLRQEKLTKQQEEAFWQWYPGYGYARPNYNTSEDRNRKEIFGMHLNEDEIPLTKEDLPYRFFEETRRAPPAEQVIPTVPDVIAADRPQSGKMIFPQYKELCNHTPVDQNERRVEEDWIDACWYSDQSQHGFFLTREHREAAQLYEDGRWRNREKINEYYRKLKSAQKKYQKIELSTSLSFYRRMTPQNDVFKHYRCDAIVEVFRDKPKGQIIDSIVFEGQQYVPIGDGHPPDVHLGLKRDNIVKAMEIVERGQSQPHGSADHLLAGPCNGHMPIPAYHLDELQTGGGPPDARKIPQRRGTDSSH
eukprot:4514303-Amphidinium_carterae.2